MIVMKSCMRYTFVWIIIVGLVMIQGSYGDAQTTVNQQTPVTVTPEEEAVLRALTTLKGILEARNAMHMRLRQEEDDFKAAVAEAEKIAISTDIFELRTSLNELDMNFESIATGADLNVFAPKPTKAFDWQQELQSILEPIIEELKTLTARPREIERLRNDVATYEKQLEIINDALDRILLLKQHVTTQELEQRLSAIEADWTEKERQVSNQLEVAEYQLSERLDAEQPHKYVREFFSSKGRNLVLAVLAFFSVFLFLRYLYRYLLKISPFHKARKRTFYARLIDVLYKALTLFCAMLALILVFYITEDWVLLGIVFVLLFGVAWTARQWFPMFWERVKLLLNVSSVREDERVVVNGLPWRVASLSLYTRLHNPALKGGLIRIPLHNLTGLQSRPYHKDEPWFPCQEEDWMLLDDGTFAKVVMQTPEIVQLVLLGGSHKTYPTASFLAQNPINLSTNFRLNITFGIDYRHQAISTDGIPRQLKARLHSDLAAYGYQDHLKSLIVEFKEAAESSLNLAILADFAGEIARDYPKLERILQRISVDACVEHGWEIPFTQVTVHAPQANGPGSRTDKLSF
jgi:small-conductance mechanosensitive channel